MKTKTPSMEYKAYVERMNKIGNVKVKDITVDPEKYAAYIRKMECNLALLEEIQKQNAKTTMLRRNIVGHRRRRTVPKWVRYKTAGDD